ncbi:IS110 family RNA-guided transposase [Sphingobacterium tabacisoli]|uniref:IS110 family transposase n=1 Tax=Sphingobacterium tabacisoli TaxID=2044855 RepID=A0ABW5KZW5_9SPHI|nr:IS110 family transposase [Sphingobacterium tabacisoli]
MRTLKQVVGIDVGSKELVVCFGRILSNLDKKLCQYGNFRNTDQGLIKLYQWVQSHASMESPLHYVMEATGVYHEKLAYFLASKGCSISIVLPNKISNYFRTLEVKTVTDSTCSEAITLFGLERNLELWQKPDPTYKWLKQLTRERDQLVQERTMVKNQLHAEQAEAEPNKSSIERIKERISVLQRQEKEIMDELKLLVKESSTLKNETDNLTTIPGVGLLTAVTVLAETNGFEMIRNKKQLVSYAGLDIKEKQSGISIQGKPTISKRGNRYLRKSLHLPALAAIRHEEHYANTFTRLVSRHGIKMKAAVAVQRKLLELMFIIYRSKQRYDPQYHLQKHQANKVDTN